MVSMLLEVCGVRALDLGYRAAWVETLDVFGGALPPRLVELLSRDRGKLQLTRDCVQDMNPDVSALDQHAIEVKQNCPNRHWGHGLA